MHTERSILCLLQQIEKMLLNAHILLNVLILINSLRFKLCWTSTIISRISMRPLHSKWILFTLFCSFWKHILNLMSILMICTWNLNLTSLVQSSRNFIFCCFWYLLWFDLRNINLVYTFMWKIVFHVWYFGTLRKHMYQLGLPWPNILRNMLFQASSKLSGAGYVLVMTVMVKA